MDILLIILALLGFATILVSAYVFTIAARTYVSGEEPDTPDQGSSGPTEDGDKRRQRDRRKEAAAGFPLNNNGVVVARDRRRQPERRLSSF